ncbi:MAG: site-specific integrase [Saprospiraceae bacterium]|uniref:Site-specific integrase n=1 Tax=Candidatus Defluviibacterium haderslevense TaxID=2981993 RepID=A0A9D7SAB8_9BACT|nr:site-specific integrase [Candidatus Defluviibacterium haderslevense]
MRIGKASFYFFLLKSRSNSVGNAPLHCRIKIGSTIKVIATGSIINPDHWDNQKLLVNPSKNPLAFANLERWKSIISGHLTKSFFNNHDPDLNHILADLGYNIGNSNPVGILEVFNHYNQKVKKQIGQNYTLATFQKFKVICKQLEDFIKSLYKVKDIPLMDLKLKHLVEFEEYLLSERKLRQITVNKSTQRLKTIMKYAITHDYLDKDPWMVHKGKSVNIEIKYLSKAELHKLEAINLANEKLRKVRDCFIFACYSGFGYAELSELSPSNLEKRGEINWLRIKRQKTQKYQSVPLLPKAQDIWNKYDGKLPIICNQLMNRHLKEIGRIADIESNLCTHLARKTFASTVLLANNVPIKVVSTLLAHADSRITEKHYAEISNESLDKEVLKLFLDKPNFT